MDVDRRIEIEADLSKYRAGKVKGATTGTNIHAPGLVAGGFQ